MSSSIRDRYVYMIDGVDGKPCYVGVGKGDRMHQHMKTAKGGRFDSTPKSKYFLKCVREGHILKPYKIAEKLTIEEACKIEIMLISMLGRVDLGTGTLQNACAGGFGVRNTSKSTRKKMCIAQRKSAARRGLSRYSGRISPLKRIFTSATISAKSGRKLRPITLAKIIA